MVFVCAVPIVFFGTLEIAWCAEGDVILFKDGLEQGLWNKCKNKSFYKAMQQVSVSMLPRIFLRAGGTAGGAGGSAGCWRSRGRAPDGSCRGPLS